MGSWDIISWLVIEVTSPLLQTNKQKKGSLEFLKLFEVSTRTLWSSLMSKAKKNLKLDVAYFISYYDIVPYLNGVPLEIL